MRRITVRRDECGYVKQMAGEAKRTGGDKRVSGALPCPWSITCYGGGGGRQSTPSTVSGPVSKSRALLEDSVGGVAELRRSSGTAAGPEELAGHAAGVLTSSRYEWMFWDAALRGKGGGCRVALTFIFPREGEVRQGDDMPKHHQRIELYYESTAADLPSWFAHGRGGNHIELWQQVAAFSA